VQFIIHAYDGTDDGALDRRMAVRQQHLDNLQKVKEIGSVIIGGGILDDDGRMIGSVMVLDFPTKEDFDAYLENEPYITGGVWQDVRVNNYNTVILNDQKVGA